MRLLHIIATPRDQGSNTLRISRAFVESLRDKHDDLRVEVLDLFNYDLPSVAGNIIEAKYHLVRGLKIDPDHEQSWKEIETLIEYFLRADVYLITSPMWNFSIPYALKYYIDCIVQPGYLFRYNEQGQAVGMTIGKSMVCITSRGGDYSELSPFHNFDFQEPYLRAIFGLCGITNMHFVNAQPMDITPEIRETAVKAAIAEAQALATNLDWLPVQDAPEVENLKGLKPAVFT